MNKRNFILVLLVLFAATAVFAADPAEGYWKSIDEKTNKVTGVWFLKVESDGLLYGTLVWAPNCKKSELATACTDQSKYADFGKVARNQTVMGTKWLYKLKRTKTPGVWNKGHIIDPGEGKHYYGGVKREGNKLIMRGSLDKRGFIGRNQVWVKTTKAEADKKYAAAPQ